MAVLWLVGLFSTLIVQSWIQFEFGFVTEPADLEFIEYEDTSLTKIIPWKDTLMFIVIICLCNLLWKQWNLLKKEKEDLNQLYHRCHELEDHIKSF